MNSHYLTYGRNFALAIIYILLGGCGFFSASVDNEPSRADSVIGSAYSQLGKKYCPGGASPQKGFDCSGLVWWSYRQNGIKVPRITTDQARAGNRVSRQAIRAGDIMVFKIPSSPRGLHTALYAGRDSFIHSPGLGKRVRLEKLAPFWTKNLVAIRRVER